GHIELGPEGGEGGARIVAQGPPEHVPRAKKSFTGQVLARVLHVNGQGNGHGANDRKWPWRCPPDSANPRRRKPRLTASRKMPARSSLGVLSIDLGPAGLAVVGLRPAAFPPTVSVRT